MELEEVDPEAPEGDSRTPWPAGTEDQVASVMAAEGRLGPEPSLVVQTFEAPDDALLRRHLETLVGMGEV